MFFAIGEESVNFIRMARTIFDIPSDVIHSKKGDA